jgi:hypothetical protein
MEISVYGLLIHILIKSSQLIIWIKQETQITNNNLTHQEKLKLSHSQFQSKVKLRKVRKMARMTRKKKRKLMMMETQLKKRRQKSLLSRKLKVQGALPIEIK